MRRSLATWVMVAAAAAFLCLPSGCIGSRLGRKSSGASWSRPSLLGWGKKKSGTELAHSKPKPPSSTVAPGTAGLANNSAGASQPFPASTGGAPQEGVPATYASTGASAYGAGGGDYGDYGSTNAQGGSQSYASSGGAAPQRGFYGDEYQGESQAQSRSQYSQAGGGGYDSYNNTAGGSGGYQDSYGAPQGQGYEQVADQRGSSYGSGGSDYGDQYGGADSRYVSPAGGQQQYDARNPAPSQYNDGYGSQYQGTSSQESYGGSQYSSGGYNNAASQGSSFGSSTGAPVQSSTGGTPWTPGSTKSFNQQPLTPPTNSGYGGQY